MLKPLEKLALVLAVLVLGPASSRSSAQSPDKFLRAGTPIPGQYLVLLATTDFSPVAEETVPPPPPPPSEPPAPGGFPSSAALGSFTGSVADGDLEGTPNSEAPVADLDQLPAPDPQVVAAANQLTAAYGGTYSTVYSSGLQGFLLSASESVAAAMSQDPRVAYVEEDGQVEGAATQFQPPWGLDRTDQRNLPLNSQYTYSANGTGVVVYVIDSGVLYTHQDLLDAQGRRRVFRARATDRQPYDDCHGHGTHVAGTIGGKTYGIAKNVTMISVRVLDCENFSTVSTIVEGIEVVNAHRAALGSSVPAVANMSLGVTPPSLALDTAVRNSIKKRIVYVVAAANKNVNASTYSPARVTEAITVGAITHGDARASFSNYGSVLDLFAPGEDVLSAWNTSTTATLIGWGTSMAAPHVAGVAALYLQNHRSASVTAVRDALVNNATPGKITNPGSGSPNKILFSNY